MLNKFHTYKLKHNRSFKVVFVLKSNSWEDWCGPIAITAICCRTKLTIKRDTLEYFFSTFFSTVLLPAAITMPNNSGRQRIVITRRKELHKTLQDNSLQHNSTDQYTYWSTDRRKNPDLINFCKIKTISKNYLQSESSFHLSSDHSIVFITMSPKIINKKYLREPNWLGKFWNHSKWRTKL